MNDFAPSGFRFGYLVLGAGVFLVAAVVGLQLIESGFTDGQKGKKRQREVLDLLAIERARQDNLNEELIVERARHDALREARQREADLRLLTRQVGQAQDALKIRKREKELLEAEIAGLVATYRDYRAEARARLWAKAVGRRLTESDLAKSLPFEDMIVTKVNETGIMVRHATGITGIPAVGIAPALRKALDLDLGAAR